MKKQSSDWSSSGWDADDSWSNEKEPDSQGQSSPADEGWGNDWDEEGGLGDSFIPTPRKDLSASSAAPFAPKSAPESAVRLASEYNWESAGGKGGMQNDLFANVSQRTPPTVREEGQKCVI